MALMKTITGKPDLEERLREGLNAAGALFMTCVHLLVPLTLMRNPQAHPGQPEVQRGPHTQTHAGLCARQRDQETQVGAWRLYLGGCLRGGRRVRPG